MQGMPPPPEFVPLTSKAVIQNRSGPYGLVLFLVSCLGLVNLMLIMTGGRIIADLTTRHAPGKLLIADKYTSFVVGILLVNMVCIGGTWMWRRWGIYGYFVASTLFVLLVLKLTGKVPTADAIGLGAMILTALPRMHMFEG